MCVCEYACVSAWLSALVLCVDSHAAISPDCHKDPTVLGLLFASSSLQCCGGGRETARPGQASPPHLGPVNE